MNRSVPPIHLLQSFETCARLLSFKKASHELNVSPPAVSQQIKLLEEHLQVALFHREPGGVRLTKVGEQFYALAQDTLSRYRQGYQQLRQSFEAPVLRVSTITQIVADILIPALPDFQQHYPKTDLRLEACEEVVDLAADQLTCAIRIGRGNWPGVHSIRLCHLSAVAVVAPSLSEQLAVLSIEQIQQLTLIHSRTDVDDWKRATDMLGLDLSANRALYFNNYAAAMGAAENGMGVAIAMLPLSNTMLEQGRLVSISNQSIDIEEACYLVYPPDAEKNSQFRLLKDWIIEVFRGL